MKIIFNKVRINSFLSIGNAEVDLYDKGLVLVRGLNNYEPKLESNGSGKSAIFESIVWCLTGNTTRGSSSVSNQFLESPASVEIDLSLDDSNYQITRINSSPKSLKIIKDGEDISGSTYTKSSQILQSELGLISYDILTSIIILSQGLPGRFSSLRPADRKNRLDSLAGIDDKLASLLTRVNSSYSGIAKDYQDINNKGFELTGQLSSYQAMNDNLVSKLEEARRISPIPESDYESKVSELKDLELEVSNLDSEITRLTVELSQIQQQNYSNNSDISMITQRVEELKKNLASYLDSKCPTCGSVINTDELQSITKSELIGLMDKLDTANESKSKLGLMIENLQNFIDSRRSRKLEIQKELPELRKVIQEYERSQISISNLQESIDENNEKIESLKSEVEATNEKSAELRKTLEIATYYKNNVNKKFRSYLLEGVVSYMNMKLAEYSKYLYEVQGVVHLEINGNNLDVKLGDREFESLSGGEGRRVDLLLQLAQRDLCESESGFMCNLLVVDEVLDYLDSSGIQNVVAMLENKSENVDTMMVVTHRPDLRITYDSYMYVIKDESQISRVSFEQ